jgi:hypothetical protein
MVSMFLQNMIGELANSPACTEHDIVGRLIVEFQRDLTFKTCVNKTSVLNLQTHPTYAGSSMNMGSVTVRNLD